MQVSRIKQQFPQIEQSIHQAVQACQNDQSVSQELKSSVQQLDSQCRQAHAVLQQSQDESRIRQTIEPMEATADRAKQACQGAGNLQPQTKSAVMQAHDQLSQLKHQLH
jgi:chromosome segregation ATPase